MAKQRNGSVDEALRSVASAVTYESAGRWRFSLVNGQALPAEARVSSGWLELTAPIPECELRVPSYDDLFGLRINTRLDGSIRIARHFGERHPHVRADACIDQVPDLVEWVQTACARLTDAVHDVAAWRDVLPPRSVETGAAIAPHTRADVGRACSETGWRATNEEGSSLRVEIPTRAGMYTARVESSAVADRFVVELADLAGQPEVCRRAVAAMLAAVAGSVRLVKGGLVDRDDAAVAALLSPIEGSLDRSVDTALSVMAVACQVSGREVQALLDEHLGSEYLALSGAAYEEPPAGPLCGTRPTGSPATGSHTAKEEQPCLQ